MKDFFVFICVVALLFGTWLATDSSNAEDNNHHNQTYDGGSWGSHDGGDWKRDGGSGDTSGSGSGGAGAVNSNYVVFASNDLGMHCVCPGAEYFILLPPFNTLRAQVFRKGEEPRALSDSSSIRVEYNVLQNSDETLKNDPYYSNWIVNAPKYGFPYPAVDPADGRVQSPITRAKLSGEMEPQPQGWWEIAGVPSYPDNSSLSTEAEKIMTDPLGGPNRNPYLTTEVKVYDRSTDELLAQTKTVAPVAFGGCCACHLKLTENNGYDPTPLNSFKLMGSLHERESGVDFAQMDPDGDGKVGPIRCSACHLDPAMGETTPPGYEGYPTSQYTFSDVLHRWHVQNSEVLTYDPNLANNCYACHPGNNVDCYRGHHVNKTMNGRNLWCTDCHGDLNQRVAQGQLEQPWSTSTLPKCSKCHSNTGERPRLNVFGGSFLNSMGHEGSTVLCSTCHGEPHALNPSTLAKDNVQNIALQGRADPIGVCSTCHGGSSSSYGRPPH